MCKNVGYTSASFPNYFKHRTQSEASQEVHQFFPLVKAGCSANLTDFLCKVYAPPCNAGKTPLVPCRELCESARGGCEGVMKKFGFAWPDHLRCDRFPLQSTGLCSAGKLSILPAISTTSKAPTTSQAPTTSKASMCSVLIVYLYH